MIVVSPAAAVVTFTGKQSIRIPLMPTKATVTVTGKTALLLPLQPVPAVVTFSLPFFHGTPPGPTSPIVGKKANGDVATPANIVITL